MKKILYSLLIFVSLFFVVDKASAFEAVDPIFNSQYTSTQLNGFVNNNSPSLSYGVSTYNFINNIFIPNETYKTYGEYYICLGSDAYRSYCFISDNIEAFGFSDSGANYLRLKLDTSVASVYAYSINNGSKETSNSDWYTPSHYSNNFLPYQLNHISRYIKTNLPYIKYSSRNGYNTFKTADGYVFNNNDILFYLDNNNNFVINTDYKTSITPEPNIFEEEIDDINYSKMIFNFDIETLASRDYIFDYLIDFETLGYVEENGSFVESNDYPFSRPYIEYIDEQGLTRKLDIDFGYENQDEPRIAWYVAQEQEILSNISSFKLIVPMYDTAYIRYSLNFISYIPFTISYELDEEMHSYYETLVLDNKYGVIFMPKLVESNSDITTYFITRGMENILVYDTYDYKEQPVEIYSDEISSFTYSISYEKINYNLFFKTRTYSSSAMVEYDTRYFTYEIVDSKYSIGAVTNPNTGETHYVDFSNTANVKFDFGGIGDVFYFISEKLDIDGQAYILFKSSVDAFFNTMPVDIYLLILTVFAVILIGTTLALGGWK